MEGFNEWLDEVLENELPDTVKAINFNLYDDGDNVWSVELIGASRFDPDDEDWACDEVFTTREEPLAWEEDTSSLDIQEQAYNAIKEYLESGLYADKLKQYEGVGVGFVDGELFIVYTAKEE